jgi:hypothetical protein
LESIRHFGDRVIRRRRQPHESLALAAQAIQLSSDLLGLRRTGVGRFNRDLNLRAD